MIKKVLFLLLVICPFLFAQEKKEDLKKDLKETRLYYDSESKTKLKALDTYYLKNNVEIAHGPSQSFYESGLVKREINFVDGLKEGIETFYSNKGLKEHELIWKKGELVKDIVYFSEGVIKAEVDLKTIHAKNPDEGKPDIKKQVKHGVEKLYFKNGRLYVQIQWADNEQNGLETKWYDNGKKKYELTWVKGKKEGIETQWFRNGNRSSATNWKNNQLNGKMINYHENGQKKDLLEWNNGVLDKNRYSWLNNGKMIAKCTYKNGVIIKGTILDTEKFKILKFKDGRQISSIPCDKEIKAKKFNEGCH